MILPVYVVSGLPRSGTSLAMQALHAGGVEPITDGARTADTDNPKGYFEFERVKSLRSDRAWLDAAAGKVVKVIHLLLMELPDDRPYRVVFMERNLDEVLASQAAMLARSGRVGASLSTDRLKAVYEQQLRQVNEWLAARPQFSVLRVEHRRILSQPTEEIDRIADFLEVPLDRPAMVRAVDPTLYRNRS